MSHTLNLRSGEKPHSPLSAPYTLNSKDVAVIKESMDNNIILDKSSQEEMKAVSQDNSKILLEESDVESEPSSPT